MTRRAKQILLGVIILLVIAVIFVVTVLVMASVNGRSFDQEILSWFNKETAETVKTTASALISNIK